LSLLDVRDLSLHIGDLAILDRVSLRQEAGTIAGLVGESGCGKSMTALSIMGLLPRGARLDGTVLFDGEDLLSLSEREMCAVRGRRIAMIFQEPTTALNPVMTIGAQIAEGIALHLDLDAAETDRRVCAAMQRVGLPVARFSPDLYPHQLSGGQRQRVMIAMALATEPALLIADEPTTALDVAIQIDVLRLLRGIVRESAMTLLLITHDLGVIAGMCDRLAVMYAGRVVEEGPTEEVFAHLAHPYTRALVAAVPQPEARAGRLPTIGGSVPGPGPAIVADACTFADRCPFVTGVCRETRPPLAAIRPGHAVACYHPRHEG